MMPTAMRVVMALAVAGALAVAIAWIDADMEAWAETTVLVMDEPEVRHAIRCGALPGVSMAGHTPGKWLRDTASKPCIDPGKLQIGQVVVLP